MQTTKYGTRIVHGPLTFCLGSTASTLIQQKYDAGMPSVSYGYDHVRFTAPVFESDELAEFTLRGLYELLEDRKAKLPEGSYTTYLFQKGIDKILKKVGEESTEVIIAGKANDKAETIYELADLAYHAMVLMVEMGITVDDVHKELASRHVIDHKIKQEKMV